MFNAFVSVVFYAFVSVVLYV